MKVAFIGLGVMGSGMAANIQKKIQCELAVYDLRPEAVKPFADAGARGATSPADAVRDADYVFTSLPMPADMEKVGEEILPALKSGAVWFDTTTNSPTVLKRVGANCQKKGVQLLDVPVSGGVTGAKAGTLALYIGGDRAAYERGLPLLNAIGSQPMYIGSLSAGTAAKLAHNCAMFSMRLAVAEIFTMGVKAGVDPMELLHGIRCGVAGRKRAFDSLDKFLTEGYDATAFSLNLAHKDMMLAVEFGRELGVPMPVAELAYADMNEAMKRGWGAKDARAPMALQKERAGVKFKVSAEDLAATMKRD